MNEKNGEVKIFEHEMFGPLRVVERDGETWFVARDVALALGYSDPAEAIQRHCKKSNDLNVGTSPIPSPKIIPESDLYRLVMRSHLESAELFQDWVVEVVLPSIRKHGVYMTPQVLENFLTDPDTLIRLATDLKAERAQRVQAEQKAIELSAQVQASLPKVLFADSVSAASTGINVGELAKILNQNGVDTGQNRLFQQLHEHGFVMRRNGQWVPTQKSMDLGLMRVKETVISPPDREPITSLTVKVTGKGQLYFVEYFLNKKAA